MSYACFKLAEPSTKSDLDEKLNLGETKIAVLESNLRTVSCQKDDLFDQLQIRSAELESSQSLLEVLHSRNNELQFQMRESLDRITTLNDELQVSRQSSCNHSHSGNTSSEDIARLLLESEGKYEARLSEARNRIVILERDRLLAEEEWNRGINEKGRSLERLRKELEDKEEELESLLARQKNAGSINSKLEMSIEELGATSRSQAGEIDMLRKQLAASNEKEIAVAQQLHDAIEKSETLELQLENVRERESEFKSSNKVFFTQRSSCLY